MTCYLIPIGGTGARVAKALVYLCAAGCFKDIPEDINFKLMCVDSDEVNGDIKELQYLLKSYKEAKNAMGDSFPSIELNAINGAESCVWSPLSIDDTSTRGSMSEMVRHSEMRDDANDILHFLYTDNELNKVLEGGFYGHTSIGSYFMAQQVVKEDSYTEVWTRFFDGIKEDDDKIFIIGSVFGGTGASGVPTIARLIKDNPKTSKVPIGAIFVMPYFKPKKYDDEFSELPIDGDTFAAKTKTALSFYLNQNFDNIFSTMYFIGEDNDFMLVENNDCGVKQKNKANPIEVFAATAVLDFLKDKNVEFHTKFLNKEKYGGKYCITSSMLEHVKCYKKMADFLKFSIIYTKYLYPCMFSDNGKKSADNRQWCKHYIISENDADALGNVCKNYLDWIKSLVISTDLNNQNDTPVENTNLIWFNYKSYSKLYNHDPIELAPRLLGGNTYKINELDDIMHIEKNKTSKKGSDIIKDFIDHHDSKNKNNLEKLMSDIIKAM